MNPPARGLLQAFVALLASTFGRAEAVDPSPSCDLCGTKPAIMAALSRASTQARSVPMHQRVTLQLSSEKSVVLPGTSTDLEQERAKAQGATYAGVVRLEATRPGSYRVSVDQRCVARRRHRGRQAARPGAGRRHVQLRRRAEGVALHASCRRHLLGADRAQPAARDPAHRDSGRLDPWYQFRTCTHPVRLSHFQ